MKRILPILILLFTALHLNAQTPVTDVKEKLASYNISFEDLLVNLQPLDTAYSFNYTVVHESKTDTTRLKAAYNSRLRKPWYVIKSEENKKHYKKDKAKLKKRVAGLAKAPVKINENSLEGGTKTYYFIVSFTADSTTLPPAYKFLKDCKGSAYINMTSKRLEKITWENTKGSLIGNLKVSSLQLNVFPDMLDGKYRVVKEWMEVYGKYTEEIISYQETVTWSDYYKLKK